MFNFRIKSGMYKRCIIVYITDIVVIVLHFIQYW